MLKSSVISCKLLLFKEILMGIPFVPRHKVCHSKSGEINPVKVGNLIKAYVDKYKHARKHKKGEDSANVHEDQSEPMKISDSPWRTTNTHWHPHPRSKKCILCSNMEQSLKCLLPVLCRPEAFFKKDLNATHLCPYFGSPVRKWLFKLPSCETLKRSILRICLKEAERIRYKSGSLLCHLPFPSVNMAWFWLFFYIQMLFPSG